MSGDDNVLFYYVFVGVEWVCCYMHVTEGKDVVFDNSVVSQT